jgi:hypothetical protein
MIIQTVRAIRAVLEDPTTGVEAQRLALTTDDGDPLPPAIAAILDPTRDAAASNADVAPPKLPAVVLVRQGAAAGRNGGQSLRSNLDFDGIRIDAYVVLRKSGDDAKRFRDAGYLGQCIIGALRDGLLRGGNPTHRTRGRVRVGVVSELTWTPLDAEVAGGAGLVAGAVSITLSARDKGVVTP